MNERTRRTRITLALAMMCSLLVGGACSENPQTNTSPEGQAAVKGRQVIAAADAVLTGVDAAMSNGQLAPAVGLPVVKAIKQVGIEGQHLADALALVDSAKSAADTAAANQQAQNVLKTIQGLLDTAVNPIQDPASKKAVNDLLKNLTDAITRVQAVVGGK